MTFRTCGFVADQSIASYQQIFWSIVVEDKLATPVVNDNNELSFANLFV